MNRRLIALALVALATALAIGTLGVDTQTNRHSTHVHRSRGYLAAWRYLEARGVAVQRWERPLTELPAEGTLVIALPLKLGLSGEELAALERWRVGGGRLVLLAGTAEPEPAEEELLSALDLWMEPRREEAPMLWWDWKAWRQRTLALAPQIGDWPGPVTALAGCCAVRSLEDVEVLYREPGGAPAVLRWQAPGRGPVLVAPGTALANGWLGASENLAFLEALLGSGPVIFDEWHQGYSAVQVVDEAVLTPAGMVGAHLLLLYLAAIWTLSRPFGPPMTGAPPRRGSVSRDLLALAELHRFGGHAAEAGQKLTDLARELAGRRFQLDIPETFSGGEAEFLALARRVGTLQREKKL